MPSPSKPTPPDFPVYQGPCYYEGEDPESKYYPRRISTNWDDIESRRMHEVLDTFPSYHGQRQLAPTPSRLFLLKLCQCFLECIFVSNRSFVRECFVICVIVQYFPNGLMNPQFDPPDSIFQKIGVPCSPLILSHTLAKAGHGTRSGGGQD